MATKSDFAQKLLSDLRLKKERMAASQSSSSYSYSMARDGQRNYRQTYKGSQQIKAPEPVRPNTANSQRRTSGGTRSLAAEENSRQMVPYGSGQHSEHRGDLSMAFMLALQNGAKIDFSASSSMLHFLHQIGRRSLDTGKMDRSSSFNKHRPSTSQFPTFSNLHINEISKGVQNLNQILRACSNGLNFDKYSVQVGKELLKGAVDLEESLRMLVNLQEASDYMITPQRKNRIMLLEEDEEEEAKTVTMAEQKQLDLPIFSFDKRSRNSRGTKEAAKIDLKQNLMALTYHAKTLSTFSEPKSHSNSSQSTSEKGRMSSIIAKLMGLEELPEKVGPQSGQKSGTKQREGYTYATIKNAEPKILQTENRHRMNDKNVLKQDNKVRQIKNNTVSLKVEKTRVSPQPNFVEAVPKENSRKKDFEQTSNTVSLKVEKTRVSPQPNFVETVPKENSRRKDFEQTNRTGEVSGPEKTIPANQKNSREKERGHDFTKHKQQKSTEKGEIKERVQKDELQQKVIQKHRSPEAANILQEKIDPKEITHQAERRNFEHLTPGNLQKPELHQLHMLQKSGPQEEKHQAKNREHQNTKADMQATKRNGRPMKSKVPSKSMHDVTNLQKKQPQPAVTKRSSIGHTNGMSLKELPDSRNAEDFVRDENTKLLMNGNLDQKVSSPTEPLPKEKPVHVLATGKKVEFMQTLRGQTARKIDEVMSRRNGTLNNMARPLKHRKVIQESMQRRHDKSSGSKGAERLNSNRSKEEEGDKKESNKLDASVQPLNVEQQKQHVAEMTMTCNSSQEYECGSPKLESPRASKDISEDVTFEVCLSSDDFEGQTPVSREHLEHKSPKTFPSPLEGRTEIFYPRKQEQKKAPTSWTQELLTENEKHLKEILIKSPLFLNTAEAFFKLNIPVGILHASDQIYQDKVTKLTIDTGYEIMNRKGRRQELSIQPCLKISISKSKVRSLDDLVKKLYKDFERLKSYGGHECDAAENLFKMLEKDILSTDPNLNCMWDFGWNEMMFAFVETDEIVRDVERHVLDELIDEITKEF